MNKIIEVVNHANNCICINQIVNLYLKEENSCTDNYFLIVVLNKGTCLEGIKPNCFYDLSIKYLLPNMYEYNEFSIFIDNAQIRSCNDNTLVFLVDKNYSIPQLHLKIFDWIENKFTNKHCVRPWRRLDTSNKYLWTRLNYYFFQQSIYNYPDKKDNKYVINGFFCEDKLDFLCELGESLFGANGYVGSDLDGLYDSLTGGIGVNFNGACIIWYHHNYSKIKMGNEFNAIVNTIKSIKNIRLLLK